MIRKPSVLFLIAFVWTHLGCEEASVGVLQSVVSVETSQDGNGSSISNIALEINESVSLYSISRSSSGKFLENLTVSWSLTGVGTLTLIGTGEGSTFAAGAVPGSAVLEIYSSGKLLQTLNVSVVAPTSVKLVFVSMPVDTDISGSSLASITVEVQDAEGDKNPIASETVTLDLFSDTSDGLATLSGTLSQPAVNGVATFNDIDIDLANPNYQLRASSGSLTAAISDPFDMVDGSVSFVHRSVGGAATAIADSSGNAMSLSAGKATFASALPDNVGVGDAIQYDQDGIGGIDRIVFISRRYSSTEYSVRDSSGDVPGLSYAASSDTSWSIYRAYQSISDIDLGSENPLIDSNVSGFDPHSGSHNLMTSDERWYIAGYADAVEVSGFVHLNWNTDSRRYLKIYAVKHLSEVGASQRHQGQWDSTNGYAIRTDVNSDFLWLQTNTAYIVGVQIDVNSTSTLGTVGVFLWTSANPTVMHNIIKNTHSPGTENKAIYVHDSSNVVMKNNVFYDFTHSLGQCLKVNATSTVNLEHNTFHNCYNSVEISDATSTINAKYNLVQDAINAGFIDSSGSATFTGEQNITNINDPYVDSGSGSYIAGFGVFDSTVTFEDKTADNFHLSPTDTVAKDQATNSSETTDVDGETRQGSRDIGADEI